MGTVSSRASGSDARMGSVPSPQARRSRPRRVAACRSGRGPSCHEVATTRLYLFDCVGGDGVEIDAVKHVGPDAGRAGAVDPPLGVRAPEFRVGVDVVVRVGLKRDDPEDTFRVVGGHWTPLDEQAAWPALLGDRNFADRSGRGHRWTAL